VVEYARGRIALWAADDGALPQRIADLADPADARIAIANPAHAPYGRAAEQPLEQAGVLDTVRSRLVLGETVADTFEIARSGNAGVAIVARSLAIADASRYTLVPETLAPDPHHTLGVLLGFDH
jgi:molybdate transport system substrate-binding protein